MARRRTSGPPLCERIIAAVVALGEGGQAFDREALASRVTAMSDGDTRGLGWWVDHMLSLMVHRRLLLRRHAGPGYLVYEGTEQLPRYEEVMGDLIPPPQARDEWRAEKARMRRRAMREALREKTMETEERNETCV